MNYKKATTAPHYKRELTLFSIVETNPSPRRNLLGGETEAAHHDAALELVAINGPAFVLVHLLEAPVRIARSSHALGFNRQKEPERTHGATNA